MSGPREIELRAVEASFILDHDRIPGSERIRLENRVRGIHRRWVQSVDDRQRWNQPRVRFEDGGFTLEDVNGSGDLHRFRITSRGDRYFLTDVWTPEFVHEMNAAMLPPGETVELSRCAEDQPHRWRLDCRDQLIARGCNRVLLTRWAEGHGWTVQQKVAVS